MAYQIMGGLDVAAILRALDLDPADREDRTREMVALSLKTNPGYWVVPIPTSQAAEFIGISEQAFNQRRLRGTAPPSIGRGDGQRPHLYRRIDLLRWAYEVVEPCGDIRLPSLDGVEMSVAA